MNTSAANQFRVTSTVAISRKRGLVLGALALFLVGCEHRGQPEAATPQESPVAQKSVAQWRWELDYYDFDDSQVSVYRNERRIAQYQFDCNLEPPDPESEADDGESARVDVVYPNSHPAGVLIVICPVGAHSVQLEVFDPLTDPERALFHKTGSFYADWTLAGDRLWLMYDQPCTRPDEEPCEIPFETVELSWP